MIAHKKPLTVALEFEPEDQARLEQMAQAQGGTVGQLLRTWALERLEEEEDLAELDRRVARFEATGEAVPHDEVVAYFQSLGTEKELPCPKARWM
jgi:predicted transcriptional regulator